MSDTNSIWERETSSTDKKFVKEQIGKQVTQASQD
jgi:hypothetical protein